MQEVADEIGVHLDRVEGVAGKHAQTPRRIFPLKFFFTGGTTKSSGEATSQIIKERIKDRRRRGSRGPCRRGIAKALRTPTASRSPDGR